jgi:hypothetical protein
LFFFVIWEGVLAVAVGVIAPAIFIAVVADGAGEGEVGAHEGFGVEEGVVVACLVVVRLKSLRSVWMEAMKDVEGWCGVIWEG